MAKFGLLKMAGIALVVCTAAAISAPAQTFTTLFSFDGTDGANPSGLIQATDGNFYGTTRVGGAYGGGTVFRITSAGALTTLYSFCSLTNCTDGSYPLATLIQATDGNFYGTTEGGGAPTNCNNGSGGCGTVFRITPAGALTTLYSFCSLTNCTDGFYPFAKLIQATDGNFYGTTALGGPYTNCSGITCGTVFQITPAGALTTLHSFNGTDGFQPLAALIEAADGNFYGTTLYGGPYPSCYEGFGCGTVFRITPAGALTTLYSFCAQTHCSDGGRPTAALFEAADGSFYGTTFGPWLGGTVFKITPEGTLTTLHSFSTGGYPTAGLIQATDGNFYGTTSEGGSGGCNYGCGTVFEITPAGTLATLHSFDSTDGSGPDAGLIQATNGSFYGTTQGGGSNKCANGCGTVFRLSVAPAATLTPRTLSFGNHTLNQTTEAKAVTLKNSGTALLNMSGVSIDGSGFAISANACGGATLAIGKTCRISVTFTPAVLGKLTGTLTFTDNASNSPQMLPLSGTGVEPATLTPPIASLGTWAVGTNSTAKTFTLTNYQSITLSSIAISTTGDFAVSVTTCTGSLAAKGKCTISVNFTPTALGKRTGMLSVSDSANNSPQTSTLAGWGALPAVLTPAGTLFGTWAVGTTSTAKTFTLTNYQSVTLSSIAISATGDFAVLATTCTTSLAAKSTCTISVTFTPTATGTRKGKLTVSDRASNSPQTSNLAGTGD